MPYRNYELRTTQLSSEEAEIQSECKRFVFILFGRIKLSYQKHPPYKIRIGYWNVFNRHTLIYRLIHKHSGRYRYLHCIYRYTAHSVYVEIALKEIMYALPVLSVPDNCKLSRIGVI